MCSSPYIFSMFLMYLSGAFTFQPRSMDIQDRQGTKLLNTTQFKSTRKTRNVLVRKILFADDTAFLANNRQDTQEIIIRLL